MNTDWVQVWWQSEQKKFAWCGLLVLLGLSLLSVYANAKMNAWNVGFYDALQALDPKRFVQAIWKYVPLLLLTVLLPCALEYGTRWYALKWRAYLTPYFLQFWLSKKVDNPDQRISEDIRNWTEQTVYLGTSYAKELLNAIIFVVILSRVAGWWLVGVAIFYAAFSTYMAIQIGRPLIKLDFNKEKFEANFRYYLVRMRDDHAASVTGGWSDWFGQIIGNAMQIFKRSAYVGLAQNIFSSSSTLLPMVLLAPELFSGKISLGVLMQASAAFHMIRLSLSVMATDFQKIAQWLASLKRLDEIASGIRTRT